MAKDKPKSEIVPYWPAAPEFDINKPLAVSARDFLIRRFPQDLKLRAQHQALTEGTTLKGLMLRVLEEYLTKPRAS